MKNPIPKFLGPPKLHSSQPQMKGSFSSIDGSEEERVRRENEVELAEANYWLSREALQKNLNLVFASLTISTLAVLVAITAVVVAVLKN